MAFAPPEIETPEDDALRIYKGNVTWLGNIVANLSKVQFEKIHDRLFVESMDRRLNMQRILPYDDEVTRIKALAWRYRRQMPSHARLKLPPHDPIVQEMEKNGG